MNLLIDGHNLIGSNLFSDIRLSDEDDEAKLVTRLRIWHSRVRGTMTVIFDRGIPGGIDVKMGSDGLQVVFATNPAQADDLIMRRLRKAQPGLILVTNDEALLHEAAVYGVTSWRGADFVERMKVKVPERAEEGTEIDVRVSKAEVEEWLALFRARAEARRALRMRRAAENPAPRPTVPTKLTSKPGAKPAAKPVAKASVKAQGKSPAKPQPKAQPKPPATPPAKPVAKPLDNAPAKPAPKAPAKPVWTPRKNGGKGGKKR